MGFAEGLANGAAIGMRLSDAMDREARQKKLNDQEADQNAITQRANQAALKAYQDWESSAANPPEQPAQPAAVPPPKPGEAALGNGVTTDGPMTLGGGVPSFGQPADVSAKARPAPAEVSAQAPAPARTEKPDERLGILAGLQARRKALMAEPTVDPKTWIEDWGKESALRSQIRTEKIENAEKRYHATGDPGEYLSVVYPLIEDGKKFVGRKQVLGVDGKPSWQLEFADVDTGKPSSRTVTDDQFKLFMVGVRDPNKVATYEASSMLERYKSGLKRDENAAHEGEKRDTERVKSNLQLKEIAAKGKEDRRTVSARGAEDRATDDNKPITVTEGAIVLGQQPTKAGKKMVKLAEGRSKSDARYSAKDLNQMVIDNYGVSDMSGRPAGSDATQRISAAAEILLRTKTGIGANEAISQAAKDLGLNITPKN